MSAKKVKMGKCLCERRPGSSRAGMVVAIALLGSGCVNLGAVQRFATTSAATADYREVVRDYVESLDRQRLYQPESHGGELERSSAARQAQLKRLLAVQDTLVRYLAVLSALADRDVASVDTQVDRLTSAGLNWILASKGATP